MKPFFDFLKPLIMSDLSKLDLLHVDLPPKPQKHYFEEAQITNFPYSGNDEQLEKVLCELSDLFFIKLCGMTKIKIGQDMPSVAFYCNSPDATGPGLSVIITSSPGIILTSVRIIEF